MVECLDNECDNISEGGFLFKDDYFEDCDMNNLILQCNFEEEFTNFEQHVTDPIDDNHCSGCICQRVIFRSNSDVEIAPQKSGKNVT